MISSQSICGQYGQTNMVKQIWKNKYGQTITNEFSNNLTTSKRSPGKIESDRGAEWFKSIFQSFLKVKNIHYYYRFTDKS